MWTKQYKKAVTFSFDDGVAQDIHLVKLLNQYHLKATFNINTGLSMTGHSFFIHEFNIRRLALNDMIEIYHGHEIAVHTINHPHLTDLSDEDVQKEIILDIQTIENVFHLKPMGIAYPYGSYDDRIITHVREAGLLYARTVESNHQTHLQEDLFKYQPTCHINDPKIFEIIDIFLAYDGNETQILYIWGHSYEGDVNNNWEHIERVFKQISGYSDIYYGTNEQVLIHKK